MGFGTHLKKYMPDFFRAHLGMGVGIEKFSFNKNLDVKSDIQEKYRFNGDLLDIFTKNKDQVVHKWHHYIPIYDRYFSQFRMKKIRFLEIGVSKGGSLKMWRQYFGGDATIYGIDIDPNCVQFNGNAGQVRIGSQDDLQFLEALVEETGGFDVVLDDGSHQMDHILKTFKFLFPKLNDGGIYMIEDLHTSYWRKFGGAYHSKSNFYRFVSDLIDDMHHWYHTGGIKYPDISSFCPAIHIHDSIAVFEKAPVYEPAHSRIS